MSNSATTVTAPSTREDQRDSRRADTRRTWTFTHSVTGQPIAVTCMPECTIDHGSDTATPTHPDDVYCWTDREDANVTLPIDRTGTPEDYAVLNSRVEMHPFAGDFARRLPFAVVEVIDEHFISGLDPDALGTVINVLAGRLDSLRRTHASLVRIRAEHLAREARINGWANLAIDALRGTKPEVTM
jgi:hypothetical protein